MNGSIRQQRSCHPVPELASKLDGQRAGASNRTSGHGQVAADGSSIAALQSLLTTSLLNKADQLAFDMLEGVVATKSTPDSVDLKLSNYSTTAAMTAPSPRPTSPR